MHLDKIRKQRTSKPVKGVCIWIKSGDGELVNQLKGYVYGLY